MLHSAHVPIASVIVSQAATFARDVVEAALRSFHNMDLRSIINADTPATHPIKTPTDTPTPQSFQSPTSQKLPKQLSPSLGTENVLSGKRLSVSMGSDSELSNSPINTQNWVPVISERSSKSAEISSKRKAKDISQDPREIRRLSSDPIINIRKRIRHEDPPVYARKVIRGFQAPAIRKLPPAKPVEMPGALETSIINEEPLDGLVRMIMDFLFTEVVLRDDVFNGPAGGAILEIEAKIGQLVDRNTNARLYLPVLTECIVSKSDPSIRIKFESSMTEAQHKHMNEFLNWALVNSKPPRPNPNSLVEAKTRAPIEYVHTYECDTFYDLTKDGFAQLPPSIHHQMSQQGQNHKATVRVTTDQKTGKELAKIIKARVADIDIYSPKTAFDWRISVNLEMKYDGDLKKLVETKDRGKRPDRNKNRLSYKHQACQIDLTQVTPADSALSSMDKEHELEIEVSAAEIRKEGIALQNNEPNRYEALVRAFLANVKLLARECN